MPPGDGDVIIKPCGVETALLGENVRVEQSVHYLVLFCYRLHKRVQGVHGINRGWGLRALVALSSVPAGTLSTILADKRAILVELSVSSFPVVN